MICGHYLNTVKCCLLNKRGFIARNIMAANLEAIMSWNYLFMCKRLNNHLTHNQRMNLYDESTRAIKDLCHE